MAGCLAGRARGLAGVPSDDAGSALTPFRTAVSFWGQTAQITNSFVPKTGLRS